MYNIQHDNVFQILIHKGELYKRTRQKTIQNIWIHDSTGVLMSMLNSQYNACALTVCCVYAFFIILMLVLLLVPLSHLKQDWKYTLYNIPQPLIATPNSLCHCVVRSITSLYRKIGKRLPIKGYCRSNLRGKKEFIEQLKVSEVNRTETLF